MGEQSASTKPKNVINVKGYRRFRQLKAILKSLKSGSSIAKACEAAKINVITLWRWRKENIKVHYAINNAIDSRIQMIEDALFTSAMGGDPSNIKFYLCNRASNRWKNPSNFQINTSAHAGIIAPEKSGVIKLTTDELRRVVKVGSEILKANGSGGNGSKNRISQA